MNAKRTLVAKRTTPAAVGLRVKSGWATAVVLGGPPGAPFFLGRHFVELSDPKIPSSRQPYHADFATLQTNAAIVRRLVGVVRQATQRSLSALVRESRMRGHTLRGLGLVVGSVIDPELISNEHIRAHAYEGRLFRMALERAASRRHLPCRIVLERSLFATAARELHVTDQEVRKVIATLGREAGRPWRTEEKAAAVAAWLVLASRSGPATGRPMGNRKTATPR